MSIAEFPLTEKQIDQAEFFEDYAPFDEAEEEGDPWSWPWWTDAHAWELGPDDRRDDDDQADDDDQDPDATDEHSVIPVFPHLEPIEPEPDFEPAAEDRAWLAPLSIADELDDRAQALEALLLADRHDAWTSLHAEFVA